MVQNIIIGFLVIALVLSYLGINLVGLIVEGAKYVFIFFIKLLATLGFATGNLLNKTSDTLNNVVHDVDNIIIDATKNSTLVPSFNLPTLPTAFNLPTNEPSPTPSTSPIQNPISSAKTSYCLVGEFEQKRGCIEIGENDMCMSGQLFSSKEMCLNPTLTPNPQPSPSITPFNSVAMFPLPPILPNQPNDLRPKDQGIYNA